MAQDETVGGLPEGLSSAVDQLLAHPEILSMVANALGKGGAPSGSQAPAQTAQLQPTQEEPPAMGNNLPPTEADTAEVGATGSAAPAPTDLVATLAPILSELGGKGRLQSRKDDHRTCLLRALKPYVNPARREAIDYMIRLSQLSDLFKQLT